MFIPDIMCIRLCRWQLFQKSRSPAAGGHLGYAAYLIAAEMPKFVFHILLSRDVIGARNCANVTRALEGLAGSVCLIH